MITKNTLQEIIDLENKMDKLPPLSVKEAEFFDTDNMINSVFYSNLLEGNTLSKEEAVEAMLEKDNGSHKR